MHLTNHQANRTASFKRNRWWIATSKIQNECWHPPTTMEFKHRWWGAITANKYNQVMFSNQQTLQFNYISRKNIRAALRADSGQMLRFLCKCFQLIVICEYLSFIYGACNSRYAVQNSFSEKHLTETEWGANKEGLMFWAFWSSFQLKLDALCQCVV